jgi:hypothetical protein
MQYTILIRFRDPATAAVGGALSIQNPIGGRRFIQPHLPHPIKHNIHHTNNDNKQSTDASNATEKRHCCRFSVASPNRFLFTIPQARRLPVSARIECLKPSFSRLRLSMKASDWVFCINVFVECVWEEYGLVSVGAVNVFAHFCCWLLWPPFLPSRGV